MLPFPSRDHNYSIDRQPHERQLKSGATIETLQMNKTGAPMEEEEATASQFDEEPRAVMHLTASTTAAAEKTATLQTPHLNHLALEDSKTQLVKKAAPTAPESNVVAMSCKNAARKHLTGVLRNKALTNGIRKSKKSVTKRKNNCVERDQPVDSCASSSSSEPNSDLLSVKEFYVSQEPSTAYYDDQSVSALFVCNICSKQFKTNISAARHLYHHLRPDHNNIATASIKCLHCLLPFSSLHKLQLHQMWHRSDALKDVKDRNVCEICEIDFLDTLSLAYHLKDCHRPQDMPYVCGLCFYRTSIYKHVLRHFDETHKGTTHLLCRYCLRIFKLHQSSSTGICMLNVYFLHLKRHVTSRSTFRCSRCRLFYLTLSDLKHHEETDHQGVAFLKNNSVALNVTSVVDKQEDLRNLRLDDDAKTSVCFHCGEQFGRSNHLTRYRLCQEDACRFATCCRRSMSRHLRDYHSAESKSNDFARRRKPSDRPLPYYMHCHCSWYTILGNAMASHLEKCSEGRRRPTAKLLDRRMLNTLKEESSSHNLAPTGVPLLDALDLMKLVPLT